MPQIVGVTVRLDKPRAVKKISNLIEDATPVVAAEFLEDSNYYCREQTGALIDSSYRASDLDKGILKWDTDYAQEVYYTGFPATNVNPNASLMWADRAARENKEKYAEMFNEEIRSQRKGGAGIWKKLTGLFR